MDEQTTPNSPRPRIRVLPEHIANRIAAGEVAERPASVLKELVENALDAGARRIEVRLRSGGKEWIAVRDDGCGMSSEDALLALRRHATSKIEAPEDLERIRTMGFRGEALPSVAAVSRLEILTRPRDQDTGTRIRVEGGRRREVVEAGGPPGTTVTVRDLFYNVPARRRFLRSAPAELRHCTEVVNRAAIAHPHVTFLFVVDGRQRALYPAAETIEERIRAVLGKDTAPGLEPVHHTEGGVTVRGMIGRAGVHRTSRSQQLLFVNRRPVQHRGIAGGIYALYRDHLKAGQFPVYVLLIEIDPARIDVNIHPAKSEVRFRDESGTIRIVRHAVAPVLRASTPVWTPAALRPPVDEPAPKAVQADLDFAAPSAAASGPWRYRPAPPTVPDSADPLFGIAIRERAEEEGKGGDEESGVIRAAFEAARYLDPNRRIEPPRPDPRIPAAGPEASGSPGEANPADSFGRPVCWQFARTYIFAPLKGDLMIVDQHVAHERVLFEQVYDALVGEGLPSQRLVFPFSIELTPDEEEALAVWGGEVARVGFDVEPQGGNQVSLLGVPAVGGERRAADVFRSFLADLAATGEGRLEGLERVAATFACKAAVKAGDPLNLREMQELVDRLFATREPFFCPHGRPVVVRVSLPEIERRFGRA